MAKPEGSIADDRPTTMLVVGVIMAVAAAVRFWGVGGGLPASLGIDEPQIMVRSLTMVKTGDFNPHFFEYPGLFLYVQAAVIVARFLAGATTAMWSSLAQVSDSDFYLWGRTVTAALGTATVFLLYRAGTRWGTRPALIAAAVFAVMPIHVRESHFVLTDVPMTFFVTLALVLSLRACEEGTPAAFAWAGAAAGLAAGTKYTAWVSALIPLAGACFVVLPIDTRVRRVLVVLAGFAAAFLLVAPYTILDLPGFLNGFGGLTVHVPKGLGLIEPSWQVYLKHLRNATGWPAMALAGGGLVACIIGFSRGTERARFAMVLAFLPVYWWMLISRKVIYGRYLMPTIPFVCLLVGVAVVSGATWLGRLRIPKALVTAVVAAVTAAAVVQPAWTSVEFDREMSRRGTYALAMDWIQTHVTPGARVVHDAAGLHFPSGRYQVEEMRQLTDRGLEFYLAGNVDYVLASSGLDEPSVAGPKNGQAQYSPYHDLFRHLTLVFSVRPSPEHPGPTVAIFVVPR
jgi:4-amino-4-deoxy-L-arabinose transferase-like glycosyltransferase